MEKQNAIKSVIYHFCKKYNGNWENIYSAIKNKEQIIANELKMFDDQYNFISIVDNDYPNNFKAIYMPPLCIFSSGNIELLNQDEKIISIWSKQNCLDKIKELNLKKDYIYAFIYNHSDFKKANELLACGYKLILITEKPINKEFDFFKSLTNSLILSEYIPNTKIEKDQEQTINRILLGISKKSLVLDNDLKDFNYILPLFKFEHRNINVLDISNYTKEDIDKYNLQEMNY